MTVQEQMRDILKRYCLKLLDQIEILDRLLTQSGGIGNQCSATLASARIVTHEMKGTGGSLGFPDIAAAAAALDDDLRLLAKQDCISEHQLQVTKEAFAHLQAIASQLTPERSALYDADLSPLASRESSNVLLRTDS